VQKAQPACHIFIVQLDP